MATTSAKAASDTQSSSHKSVPITVRRYSEADAALWNEFVAASKNGTFLFDRRYMDYHSDRFEDNSLLFWSNEEVIAVFPANRKGDEIVSHGGLTFGGVVCNQKMKTSTMLGVFDAMLDHVREQGGSRIVYKAVPHMYHRLAAEEDLYALARNDAALIRRDVSSAVSLPQRLPLSKGRKSEISRARSRGIEVKQTHDVETFMYIEEELLRRKYNRKPVHTADELSSLAAKFPNNIKLFAAYMNGAMLGGVVIYETNKVAHAQYISATDEGKDAGALDLILSYLLNEQYREKSWFDFGISTEQDGRYLNAGLIANKESFGARAVVYDFYELTVR